MTRDELTARICQLFPPLAEVEPWEWAETEDDEPVVMIERHATFTGLADAGSAQLSAQVGCRPEILRRRCRRNVEIMHP